MSRVNLPGSTIGVLGSGQLGRMFAIAARRLGYRVHVFSPDDDTPTGQVADVEIQSSYDDLDAVASLLHRSMWSRLSLKTCLPKQLKLWIVANRFTGGHVLHATQHRIREKTFLRSIGVPVTRFAIYSLDELKAAHDDELPGVLKTASWGYDGKGQVKVASSDELGSAWGKLDCPEAILERFVDFEAELSIVAVRGQDGTVATYGPILNTHHNHILDLSVTPSEFPPKISAEAIDIARVILNELEVVGVLCIEFFLTTDGKLLVNELAPRPHNSGHLTIDAHATCQFEQQVRAVCGLPLGSATQLRPAAMANLLGDLWQRGEPDWKAALAVDNLKLHLYGKREARVGRKMGHLTVLDDSAFRAAEKALAARRSLAVRLTDEP